jgi:hypothetical protein
MCPVKTGPVTPDYAVTGQSKNSIYYHVGGQACDPSRIVVKISSGADKITASWFSLVRNELRTLPVILLKSMVSSHSIKYF